MARVIIPTKDADFDAFVVGVAATITAAPAAYMLGSADAGVLTDEANVFHTKLAIAVNPATRTHASVRAKDIEKGTCRALFASYLTDIKNNIGITDADKGAVGIDVTDNRPSAVPVPDSMPTLAFGLGSAGNVALVIVDEHGGRAKPFGVKGCLLVSQPLVGDPLPAVNRDSSNVLGIQTVRKGQVAFDQILRGETCAVWGVWFNTRGQFGPYSAPVQVLVP